MKEKLAAEFIGTFTLILIGAGAIMNGKADLLGIALAHGLAIAIMVSAFAAISGAHFNPGLFWNADYKTSQHQDFSFLCCRTIVGSKSCRSGTSLHRWMGKRRGQISWSRFGSK